MKNNKIIDYIKNLFNDAKNGDKISIFKIALTSVLVVIIAAGAAVSLSSFFTQIELEAQDEEYDKNDIVIDTSVLEETSTILELTEDAGQDYIDETLFIGDSNTVRTMMYGHTTWDNVLAAVSMGIQHVEDLEIAYFEGYSSPLNIADALEIIQPKRIIITYGTNNTLGWSVETFIEEYKKSLDIIKEAYPYADIIINTIPPVDRERENLAITMQTIDSFNKALSELAVEEGVKFLNSAEVLKDETTGFAKTDYTIGDGVHLSKLGMDALFEYIRTHAYIAEDRRPMPLNDIPAREETPTGIIQTDPLAVRGGYVNVQFKSSDSDLGSIEGEYEQRVKRTLSTQEVLATADYENGGIFIGWSAEYGSISTPANPSLVYTVPDIDENITYVTVTANFGKVTLNMHANNDIVTDLNLTKGSSEQLSVSASHQDYNNKNITWQSNNAAAVTVDASGKITANDFGTATITATIQDTNVSVSIEVTILKPLDSISISGSNQMSTNSTTQLTLGLNPQDAYVDAKNAVWSIASGDATVSSTGLVTSNSTAGSVVVSCSLDGKTTQHTISVVAPVPLTGITFSASKQEITLGESMQITIVYNPEGTTDDTTATWESSNPSVATVDANGLVTGVAEGTTVITAKVGSFASDITITVAKLPNVVKSVTLDQTSITLDYQAGSGATLTATPVLTYPSDAPEESVTPSFSSENEFFTVDGNGVITLITGKELAGGTSTGTITVTIGSAKATCTVTINNIPVPVVPTSPPVEEGEGETETEGETTP